MSLGRFFREPSLLPWGSARAGACTAVLITIALLHVPLAAQAQSAEAVAWVAQSISVRLESATPGSGVLVKRDGNRYTVLTAWHVVSGHRPGEELDIYTPDGARHSIEQGSIKRLGEVDLAVLTFTSSNSYELARVGDVKSVLMGSPIYVAGFPLPSSAVPTRLIRFLKGDVVANAQVFIPNGYQLLYSNPTLPGMSGGAVLNAQGQLVGIHGQAETDSKMSEQEGVAVKTSTNQAVLISYYQQFLESSNAVTRSSVSGDQLRQASSLYAPLPPSEYGVVRFGDTLFKIALRYNLTLGELLRLNPGMETARLVLGSPIRLAQPRSLQTASSDLGSPGFAMRENVQMLPSNPPLRGYEFPEFKELLKSLANGDYALADKQTEDLVAKSVSEAVLTLKGAEKADCDLLRQIDNAWISASEGKYGFSVQLQLIKDGFVSFEVLAGWKRGGFLVPLEQMTANYPRGYFPRRLANGPILIDLLRRVQKCT